MDTSTDLAGVRRIRHVRRSGFDGRAQRFRLDIRSLLVASQAPDTPVFESTPGWTVLHTQERRESLEDWTNPWAGQLTLRLNPACALLRTKTRFSLHPETSMDKSAASTQLVPAQSVSQRRFDAYQTGNRERMRIVSSKKIREESMTLFRCLSAEGQVDFAYSYIPSLLNPELILRV